MALLFQMRQCSRSTSVTIGLLASVRPGSSVGNPLAGKLRVLQPHGDVEPVRVRPRVTPASARIDRRPGQPSVNAVTLVAAVRPTASEAPANLIRNVGVGSGDGTEDLPPAVGCLDVANANFQMPVTFLAATSQCRVHGDGDAHGCCWPAWLLACHMLPPILSVWARNVSGLNANVRRQKMPQHVGGGDTKGHQGGEMGAPADPSWGIDNVVFGDAAPM